MTDPQFRRIVRDFIRSKAYLVPAVAPAIPGVCAICRGPHPRQGRFPSCYYCGINPGLLDALGFCIYATDSDASNSGRIMYSYKSTPPSEEAEQIVTSLLFEALDRHLDQVPHPVDVITTVPSISSGRPVPHPLSDALRNAVQKIDPKLPVSDALQAAGHRRPGRNEVCAEDFTWSGSPPIRVLLVDDTWVKGNHMRAAAQAVRAAGAQHVSGLTVARWMTHRYQNCDDIFKAAELEHATRDTMAYPVNPFTPGGT